MNLDPVQALVFLPFLALALLSSFCSSGSCASTLSFDTSRTASQIRQRV